MPKVTFLGAGSTVFAKNIIGDCMLTPAIRDWEFAMYDIDAQRLDDSVTLLQHLNANTNEGRASITGHLGVENRQTALRDADYVVNAVQIGGYEPSTVIDFEIPKKYGLKQTIADTLGIGGIFRTLRTGPIMLDFAHDIEAVCPDAWLLNYANPMGMVTSAVLRGSEVRMVGLCHSVQACAPWLLRAAGKDPADYPDLQWHIAGINHMGWLLEITDGGRDLYPEIKEIITKTLADLRAEGGRAARKRMEEEAKAANDPTPIRTSSAFRCSIDMTRLQLMLDFGHYVTESSEHFAEYNSWYIKERYPDLIDEYNIPIDEYIRRCKGQIAKWAKVREGLVANADISHNRTGEYGSYIMEAMQTDQPYRIGGNVMNDGLITNLPAKACVEVPCMVDRTGVQPCHVGDLPEQCAALNRTNVNVQILTAEAVLTGRKDYVYQAAMLDPHTAGELSRDDIRAMCDDLFDAHGEWIPRMK